MELSGIKQKAFTLLELLAVIAIVALLLAIIVPSLARAKERGREIYCQNNLHQMYLAAMVYTANNNGFFPIAYYTAGTPSEPIQYCWDFTVHYDGGPAARVEPGVLWQGETIEKVQQCPSFKGESNAGVDPYTGYNYNTSYLGHGQNEMPPVPDRWTQMKRPAYCALFGDGEYGDGANKFMRSPLPSDSDWSFVGRWAGTQGYRHHQKTNVIWCDGKVESRQERFAGTDDDGSKQTIDDHNRRNPQSPIGFLSADNGAYRPR